MVQECVWLPKAMWAAKTTCLPASRHKSSVEILQKQMDLLEVYMTMKSKLFTQSTNYQGRTVVRQQPDHFSTPTSTLVSSKPETWTDCYQDSQKSESYRLVKWISPLNLSPPRNATNQKVSTLSGPLLTQGKETPSHTDVLSEEASSSQSGTPKPENTLEYITFQNKGKNALTQTQAEDKSRLSKLIQRGVIPFGSALQLLLKVRQSFSFSKVYLIPV